MADCLPKKHNIWSNVGLLLGHRLRRWPNTKPTLVQNIVFAGCCLFGNTYNVQAYFRTDSETNIMTSYIKHISVSMLVL